MAVNAPVDELERVLGGDRPRERRGVAPRGAPQSWANAKPVEPPERTVGVAFYPVAAPVAVTSVLIAVQADGVPATAHSLDDRRRALGANGDGEERRRNVETVEQFEQAGGPLRTALAQPELLGSGSLRLLQRSIRLGVG